MAGFLLFSSPLLPFLKHSGKDRKPDTEQDHSHFCPGNMMLPVIIRFEKNGSGNVEEGADDKTQQVGHGFLAEREASGH